MNKLKELINELCPNGVKYKNIQELCKISRGKVMSKDFIKANAGEYPVYSQTENNGELGKISTYDFDGEYLTWTTDGANAGSVFYRKGKFSVTNVCGLLEIKSKVMIPKFLYYVLSIEAPKYVNAGMGNPKLMSNVMAKIRVAVPPLEVQCEIVHILDDFTLLSAELSAELEARKRQYCYYREKLFEFNNDGELKTMGELFPFIRNGFVGTIRPFFTDEKNGIRYLEGTNIHNGIISDNEMIYVTKEFHQRHKKNELKEDDILMVQSGHIGECAVVGKKYKGANCHALIIMSNGGKCLSKYIVHYFHTLKGFKALNPAITGGTIKHVLAGKIGKIKVPCPPIEEQTKIVNILDKLEKLCNDISEGLPAEIEARQKQYEYYRAKLLKFKELKVNE